MDPGTAIKPMMNPLLKCPAHTSHDYPGVEEWCVANIGPWNETWYKVGPDIASIILHYDWQTTYYFKTEKDQLMFILRWA